LWITASTGDQLEVRNDGLEYFQYWYDRTVEATVEAEVDERSVWPPDDGRPAHILVPKKVHLKQDASCCLCDNADISQCS